MKMKFTARRQQKKATIMASKQTVEQALNYAHGLKDFWVSENANDPRIREVQNSIDFLQSILDKDPQQMAQDGVSSIEEYFDDSINPDIANEVKAEVDQIANWRWERAAQVSQPQTISQEPNTAGQPARAPGVTTPAMASAKKKADGGAAFSTDRDEKGEAKSSEKVEVPRLAAEAKICPHCGKSTDTWQHNTPGAVCSQKALDAHNLDKSKGKKAQAPVAAPVAPAVGAPAPIPEDGTFDIKTLSTEALAKAIKALVSIKEFEEDKSAQALIEEMTAELKTRPIEQEAPKGGAPAAAPAAAPIAPPAAAPVASAKKKAMDDPGQASVSLGGLNTAPAEPPADSAPAADTSSGFTASSEKVAVTPPGISEELAHKIKKEYPGEKDKAYATMWKIHNEKNGSMGEVFAVLDKIANAQGGSWFVDGGQPMDVTEDGGRTQEIGEAHSKLDYSPAKLERPETTAPIKLNEQQKLAADMTVSKAVKESERFGSELKALYLSAKSLTNVNNARPVREAVEAIFRAADLFNEATKVLSKQQMQAESEEAAAKIKDENKGKKSSFGGLAVAAGE